jgi:hypothetical protein
MAFCKLLIAPLRRTNGGRALWLVGPLGVWLYWFTVFESSNKQLFLYVVLARPRLPGQRTAYFCSRRPARVFVVVVSFEIPPVVVC